MFAGDREFKNPFPNFKETDHVIDSRTRKLFPGVESTLSSSFHKLLHRFEEHLSGEIDYSDNSVYTGTAGIALLYFHLANVCERDQNDFIKKAMQILEKSISRLKGRRFSFLCGDPGPLAIGAALYHKAGMARDSQQMIQQLQKLSKSVTNLSSDIPDELLYGRVGYLYSLLFVQKYVGEGSIDQDLVKQVVKAVLQSGKHLSHAQKSPSPLMYMWHEKHYLGAAHGLSGILYMLLQARSYMSSEDLNTLVKPSVDFMRSLQFSSGNYPSSLGNDSDRLIHWCHGAPGVIHLLALAYQVFGDEKYLDAAKKCGKVIWSRGLLRKGHGICHGVAGNGYAFARLYQLTGEEKYVYKAVKFAEWCYDYGKHGCRIPDHPLSLFEGMAGTLYYLADMLNPAASAFPAFQLF